MSDRKAKEVKPPRADDDRNSGGPIIRATTIRDFVREQRTKEGRR